LFYLLVILFSTISILSSTPGVQAGSSSDIDVIKVEGTIVPVTADFIERVITESEKSGSAACVIELNTPGGLLNATERIVQRILNAKIPVIVYVTPHGAWAASAGTFITISANVAVMSPGSTIGAAHPVDASGQQSAPEVTEKATNYSAAWIRSIAEKRHRNADEVELAVTESKSFTADQALTNNLIDFIANDFSDLMNKLDGRTIVMSDNSVVILKTGSYTVIAHEFSGIEQFLHSISDPNLAYILLGLASIGLFTEIANPGLIFPGVLGGICLFISLYALGALNANWAGLLLIFLGIGLFFAELFTSAFGILTAGGIISLVIGSMLLFINNPRVLQVDPGLIIAVVIIVSACLGLIVWAVVRGQTRKIATGEEGLVGKTAIVKTQLNPRGMVMVEGELWNASIDEGSAEPEEEVIVKKVEGLKFIVTRNKQETKEK